MKKFVVLLMSVVLTVAFCVPAFAAENSSTTTLSLDKIEDLLPGNSSSSGSFSLQLLNARIKYLTYCNDVLTTDSDTGEYSLKSQSQDSAKKKLEMGYISQKDYDNAVQTVTDQLNSQTSHSIQRSKDLLSLRHMFALDDEDKLVVKPADYSGIDLDSKVSNINYSKDLKNLGWDDLFGSDSTDPVITGNVETFKGLYDSLKLAGQTYHSDSDSYQKKLADLQLAQVKLKSGYTTQKEVDDLNKQAQVLANTVAKDRNSLYMAYLQYDYMRDQGENPNALSMS